MDFANHINRVPTIADQMLLQQQLKQQQQQQANMILLQQQIQRQNHQNQTEQLSNLHLVPEMRTLNADLMHARLHNQNNLSRILQAKSNEHLHGHATRPLVLGTHSEIHSGLQNMYALQDELQRQVLQRKLEEEIRMVNDLKNQQALAIELERQTLAQRSVNTAQLLNQFSSIDQLTARQELLSRSTADNVAASGVYASGLVERSDEILGMNGLGGGLGPFSSNHGLQLSQRHQLDGLPHRLNEGGRQLSHAAINVQSHLGFKSLENVASAAPRESATSSYSRENIVEACMNSDSSSVNQSTPQQLETIHTRKESFTDSSSVSLQQQRESRNGVDPSLLPKVRYFNSDHEVKEGVKEIEKKANKSSKKQKLPKKCPKELPIQSTKTISKFQRKLPLRKGIMDKMAKQKMSKKEDEKSCSDDEKESQPTKRNDERRSSRSNTKGKKSKKKVTGPHHDLMLEFFPFSKKEQSRKKDEDKLSAATALLGFSKST